MTSLKSAENHTVIVNDYPVFTKTESIQFELEMSIYYQDMLS